MTDNEIIQQYKKYEPFFTSWYIKRFIGEGGFAKVFEIVRNDFGKEYVSALKIITVSKSKSEINTLKSEGMSDEDIRKYLQGIVEDTVNEIQLMYKLRGKGNIVNYEDHAVVEHEDGMGWDILIKMEYLTSLSTYIRQQKGRLAKSDIIRLGVDICKSLEACQKYNIIHRDIKADNIFISDEGEFKLGDFGIARVIERKDQTLSKKGTSAYMAPEVYKGQTYTSAVDIYSLGMVMYRLMNNNRGPFLPPYPEQMSLDDRDHAMMLRMSGEKFPKPNQVTRGRLVEIVLKACAYRPEERYSSPGFMRQELESIYLDTDEMTTEEWVMIYDEEGRNSGYSTSSFSQNSMPTPGSPELTGATEVLREEGATEVLREEGATGVLREESATEVLRKGPAPAHDMVSAVTIPCIKCGGPISRGSTFCSICGASQRESVRYVAAANQRQGSSKRPGKGTPGKKPIVLGTCAAFLLLVAVIFLTVGQIRNWVESSRLKQYGNVIMYDVASDGNSTVLSTNILRTEIITITLLDSLDTMPDDAWDVSLYENGSVMAWAIPRSNGYDLYIGGEGGVITRSASIFSKYPNLEKIDINGNLYMEDVQYVSLMFSGCASLTSINLSGLDTSNLTDMGWMFSGCERLASIDLSGLDTSNVTNMSYMFSGCASLTSIDLSDLDTSNVTDMGGMFSGCASLTSIDVSGFDTSKVTDMGFMFSGCASLTSINLSGLDTSKVTDMGLMFYDCASLTSIDLSDLDTSNVTNMGSMFSNCENLTSVDLSSLDTSKVTDMGSMFFNCASLTSIDVSGFDTSKVTDMGWMFYDCASLTSIDVSGFDTSKVTDMGSMFFNCASLTSIDVSGFDTSKVTDMSWMFSGCVSLTSIDVSGLDTSNVTDMSYMFFSCDSLKEVYLNEGITQDQIFDMNIPSDTMIHSSKSESSDQQTPPSSEAPSDGSNGSNEPDGPDRPDRPDRPNP